MIKKIRIWLAGKLLDLAIYVEFETVLYFTMDVTATINALIAEKMAEAEAAKPKRGRPKGSKTRNVQPGKTLGRPKGRKDGVGTALRGKANDNA